MPLRLELLPATSEDFEQLVALRIAAMRESLERIGRFNPARARERFRASFVPEETRHIHANGQRVGLVCVSQTSEAFTLDHLYISPEYQGRSIGSAVLGLLFAEADAARLPIHVGALRESASNRFYLRHGFLPSSEGEWDLYYTRPAR